MVILSDCIFISAATSNKGLIHQKEMLAFCISGVVYQHIRLGCTIKTQLFQGPSFDQCLLDSVNTACHFEQKVGDYNN